MTDVKTPAAEPSAAQPVQYDGWDDKGTPIVKAEQSEPKKAESAAAKESKPDPGKPGESAAESGAAKESKQESRKPAKDKDKLTADERIEQLEATIERIKRESGRATPTKPQAEPSAAKPAEPAKLERPKRPNPAEFTKEKYGDAFYEKYEEAMDKYADDLSTYNSKKAIEDYKAEQAKEAEAREQRDLEKRMSDEIAEAEKRHPDFREVVAPAYQEFHGDPQIPLTVKHMMFGSEVRSDLMYTLAGDQKQWTEFLEMSRSNPRAALVKIALVEQLVREELGKAAKPDQEPTGKKETPAETKPRAPKPPSEVGGRGTVADDSLVTAAKSNNFRDFEAEQWRRVKARTGA